MARTIITGAPGSRRGFITVDVLGLDKVKAAFNKIGADAPRALAQALFLEAEGLIGEAKEKHVPVDLEALRASGFVMKPVISGSSVSVECGFGGPSAPYALSVHENPRAGKTGGLTPAGKPSGRKTWATTGGWKYLENPFNSRLSGLEERVAASLRSWWRARGL